MKQFPKGFLWGAATSAFQVEGGDDVDHDWNAAARAGMVPRIGTAADHYHRYEEDFDIAKSLDHNAHRFSVEWARIEPEEGKFDEVEIVHYQKVVAAIRARGMEPFVTLWHFSLPVWFSKSGNFRRKDGAEIFARYCAKMTMALPEAKIIMTMNEPEVWLGEQGEAVGACPRPEQNFIVYLLGFRALVRAHNAAYRAIKKIRPDAQIGIGKHQFSFVGRNPLGSFVAICARFFWNRLFLNLIRAHQDYIGIQFYERLFFWGKERGVQESDIGWQLIPGAIYDPLMEAARYKLPIYITENGLADAKDQYREKFIKDSLTAVHKAITDGAQVKGYLHWSLLDNYEFKKAYTMQFGLVAIDRAHDLARIVRPSARAYAEICKSNSL